MKHKPDQVFGHRQVVCFFLEKMRIPVGGERWSSGVRGDRSCGRRRAPAATGRKANARHQKISATTRAHEGRAALSAVDSATRWGRLLAAVADSILVLHRALPDLQRMKHKPDQAFGHREVFCFFLVLHRALPDLQRMKHKPDQAFGHRQVVCFFLEKMRIPVGGERWSSGVRGDRSCGRRRAPAATGRNSEPPSP
jgi:hypothetical protein